MRDLKTLTVRILRQLAREHLIPGYGRLKKAELIGSLKKYLSNRSGRRVKVEAKAPPRPSSAKPPRAAETVPIKSPRPAESAPLRSARVSESAPVTPRRVSDPMVEGFFLGRQQSQAQGNGESRLPVSYGDDALHLLPRDPHSLLVFWDFDDRLRQRAAAGLKRPRSVLRVFERGRLVREVEVVLEARNFYLFDLQAGSTYHIEAHFIGEGQRSRRIGRPSNAVALPGPSQVGPRDEVRLLRVPIETRLPNLKEAIGRGEAQLQTLTPEQARALGSVPVLGMVRTEDSSSERPGGPSGRGRWNPSGQSWNPSRQS
jgi:hypothetical protein